MMIRRLALLVVIGALIGASFSPARAITGGKWFLFRGSMISDVDNGDDTWTATFQSQVAFGVSAIEVCADVDHSCNSGDLYVISWSTSFTPLQDGPSCGNAAPADCVYGANSVFGGQTTVAASYGSAIGATGRIMGAWTPSGSATFTAVLHYAYPSLHAPPLSKYQPCPSQNDNGVLPGSWTFTPPVVADSSGIGLDLNGSVISKNFSLSKFHQYSIDLSYKLSTAGTPELFTFSFGKGFVIDVASTPDDTEDTLHFPAASYEPTLNTGGSDIYTVTIGEHSTPPSPHLVITYFCITDTSGPTAAGTGGAPIASCKDCTYEATGDLIGDLLGVLKWIWCGISQLWDCTIKSVLYGIWKFIGVIITALAFLRQWLGLIFSNGTPWFIALLGILWNFIRGLAGNLIQTAFNSLAGIFNALGLTGVINAILAFLSDIPRGISQLFAFIPGVVSLISTIWDFITYWVTVLFNLVTGILGAIPVVFASVAQGFNTSAAAIPVYAPSCNDSNTLFFGPCLGMYIIDNTIFDGPMFYVFPLVLGFIALNTIAWSIEKMKEALSGD